MESLVEKLKKQYLPENRYNVFGSILLKLRVKGIKGTECEITFDYPVTAIAGYNGAGKSTIAQIALCMYKSPDDEDSKRKYLKDFFMKTLLDKQPYASNSQIVATYASDNEESQISLIDDDFYTQSKENIVRYSVDRWAGYKYQPPKSVYYYGMSFFIPYQEQNSNLLKDNSANIKQTDLFSKEIVKKVADILSINYTDLQRNSIANDKRTEQVISASKSDITYSENHMGCGEGRLLKLVNAMENAPDKSLFVIEEPETALHQLAQHRLALYFLDVCLRKHHQIIFTTHSPEIQKSLPIEARKYILRDDNGTRVISGPSIAQIENYLSGGYLKRMIIVTEDEVASLYVKEILRAYNTTLFINCEIFAMNLGYKELKKYVQQSQSFKIKIFGVVDEFKYQEPDKYIVSFPDKTPPEVSFFTDDNMRQFLKSEFGFDFNNLPDDHHGYFQSVARTKEEEIAYVQNRCVKQYVKYKGEDYFKNMISQLEQWLKECN